ncbi:uncharacterized protein AB675_8147 [Cyphellophora attinorum]|uniref:BTB domain-containing protein n=1 Tax=Cyphellophora attinorum TaxID=1664694 RepID=A0A0N0NN22_9EURO|nr:uncharacterized protein AB675_8147 [Phialophora attinorum]KPI41018.1 hypothetical protein AB675_8147 [Phialophora attinorum]
MSHDAHGKEGSGNGTRSVGFSVQHAEGPVTTVHVGTDEDKRTFRIHLNLMRDNSEYFNTMFIHGFKEKVDNEVILEEYTSEAFSIFVDWLYVGFLKPSHKSDDLVDVWILAHYIGCTQLVDETLDLLKEHHDDGDMLIDGIEDLQKAGHENSKLMQYLVEELAYRLAHDFNGTSKKSFDKSPSAKRLAWAVHMRLMEQLAAYSSDTNRAAPSTMQDCTFHVHEKERGVQCPAADAKRMRACIENNHKVLPVWDQDHW